MGKILVIFTILMILLVMAGCTGQLNSISDPKEEAIKASGQMVIDNYIYKQYNGYNLKLTNIENTHCEKCFDVTYTFNVDTRQLPNSVYGFRAVLSVMENNVEDYKFYELAVKNVDDFQSCFDAGYNVRNTDPRECITPAGEIYTQVKIENQEAKFCSQDVKECFDGSFVKRDPENNCEFNKCPIDKKIKEEIGLRNDAQMLYQDTFDINKDWEDEILLVVGYQDLFDPENYYSDIHFYVLKDQRDYVEVYFHTDKLVGTNIKTIEFKDINGDERGDILIFQEKDTFSEVLQILTVQKDSYRFINPEGGYFQSKSYFGESEVLIDDIEHDFIYEIIAGYGSESFKKDIYKWDGKEYSYVRTIKDENDLLFV